MRHRKKGKRLGTDESHNKAILRGLAAQLIVHERITTTERKAKELRPFAEKIITKAKAGDVASRREVLKDIEHRDIAHKLMSDVAPRYADRPGGYTRIIKLEPRKGDAARMAFIELV